MSSMENTLLDSLRRIGAPSTIGKDVPHDSFTQTTLASAKARAEPQTGQRQSRWASSGSFKFLPTVRLPHRHDRARNDRLLGLGDSPELEPAQPLVYHTD